MYGKRILVMKSIIAANEINSKNIPATYRCHYGILLWTKIRRIIFHSKSNVFAVEVAYFAVEVKYIKIEVKNMKFKVEYIRIEVESMKFKVEYIKVENVKFKVKNI